MRILSEFSGYRILERLPNAPEYLTIARQINGSVYPDDVVISKALEHSLYGVVAEHNDQIIGMGRIIGDDATLFIIQDVLVLPAFNGLSIETAILDALLIHLEDHAPDHSAVISLPSITSITFYEQLGFKTTAPHAFGMFRIIDRTNPDRQHITWK